MNKSKSIFAGLVILAVAGCRSTTIGTAAPVSSTAAAPVSSPADAPVSSPADAPVSSPAAAPVSSPAAAPVSSPADAPASSPACVVSLNAPQCQSTAPDLTVDWVSTGNTSGCTFTWSINWGDGSAAQQFTVDGQQEAGEYFFADHTYQSTQTQTYSITTSDVSVTGSCTISPGSYTFTKTTPAPAPSKCTTPYEQPANWDTAQVTSTTPGIANYIEPLNVIISACSTVSLSDIQAALGDWDTVYPSTEVTLDHARIKCISPEEANVAGDGYVTEQEAWRYEGCREGNVLSVAGLENHVRIWNQTVPGSNYGAWFITASYETACVSVEGELYPFANPEGRLSLDFFHCVDGGPGSYDTGGYDRGAKDFAHDVALAAGQKGWKVSEETITQPLTGGNVGEDGAPFDGTVYVLTVTN